MGWRCARPPPADRRSSTDRPPTLLSVAAHVVLQVVAAAGQAVGRVVCNPYKSSSEMPRSRHAAGSACARAPGAAHTAARATASRALSMVLGFIVV